MKQRVIVRCTVYGLLMVLAAGCASNRMPENKGDGAADECQVQHPDVVVYIDGSDPANPKAIPKEVHVHKGQKITWFSPDGRIDGLAFTSTKPKGSKNCSPSVGKKKSQCEYTSPSDDVEGCWRYDLKFTPTGGTALDTVPVDPVVIIEH